MDNSLINEVVVDPGMIEQALQSVYEVPDLFNCLQFGLLAEAIALHDRLVIETDSGNSLTRDDADAAPPSIAKEMLAVLVHEGIVVMRDSHHVHSGVDSMSELRSRVLSSGARVRVVDEDYDLVTMIVTQASNILDSERRLDRPGFLLAAPQAAYDSHANVKADNSVCDLTGHYDTLAATLFELRNGTKISMKTCPSIPLPPIAYHVFAKSRSLDALLSSAISVRGEFEDLRDRLAKLQSVLDDPTEPLKAKLREKRRWETRWRQMHDRYDQLGTASLALTNSAIYAAAPEIPGAMGLNPGAWAKLLSIILESAPELWSRWRLRAIHRSATAYLKAPDSGLTDAIARVRGREVGPEETKELSGLLDDLRRFSETKVII